MCLTLHLSPFQKNPYLINAVFILQNVVSTNTYVGNCLFVNDRIVCSNPTRSRFTGVEPASGITIDNLNEVTLGIGISQSCDDDDEEDREYCKWEITWSKEAHDANIKEVWYKDDSCFWDSAGDGRVLQDAHGRDMCYSNFVDERKCKMVKEDPNRIKTHAQIQAICGRVPENKDLHSSSSNGLEAMYVALGTPQEIETTETSDTEKDSSFNENQNYDLGLETRSIDKHRSEKRQGSSSIKLRARPFLS